MEVGRLICVRFEGGKGSGSRILTPDNDIYVENYADVDAVKLPAKGGTKANIW